MEILADPWFWGGVISGILTIPGLLAGVFFWPVNEAPEKWTSWSREPLPGIELTVDQDRIEHFLDSTFPTVLELRILHRSSSGNPFPGELLLRDSSRRNGPWARTETVLTWESGEKAAILFPGRYLLLYRGVSEKWYSESIRMDFQGTLESRLDGLPREAWLAFLAQDLKMGRRQVWYLLSEVRGFWTEEIWWEAESLLKQSAIPGLQIERPRELRTAQ